VPGETRGVEVICVATIEEALDHLMAPPAPPEAAKVS
jgi:hypothetical protein